MTDEPLSSVERSRQYRELQKRGWESLRISGDVGRLRAALVSVGFVDSEASKREVQDALAIVLDDWAERAEQAEQFKSENVKWSEGLSFVFQVEDRK